MTRVIKYGEARAKPTLDSFDGRFCELGEASQEVNSEREIAVQLMSQCELRPDEATCPTRGAAENLADDGHDSWWDSISSHNLRRSGATFHTAELGIDIDTILSIGGRPVATQSRRILTNPTKEKASERTLL